jgi:hypothetical protein
MSPLRGDHVTSVLILLLVLAGAFAAHPLLGLLVLAWYGLIAYLTWTATDAVVVSPVEPQRPEVVASPLTGGSVRRRDR